MSKVLRLLVQCRLFCTGSHRADALNIEKVAFAIGLKILANLGNIGFFDVFVFAAFVRNSLHQRKLQHQTVDP